MKKTIFKDNFSIAMSLETGCIVMVKNGNTVVGSLTRDQSVGLADSVLAFMPMPKDAPKPALKLVRDGN